MSLLPYRDLYTDVTLKVSDGDSTKFFPCHRVVLAARSRYFRTLLDAKMKESCEEIIVLHDTNPDLFEVLLNYFYSEKLEYDFDSWREHIAFYMLAQFYEILEVKEESMYGHPVPDDQFHEYVDFLALALGGRLNNDAISDIASKIGPKTDLSKLRIRNFNLTFMLLL